MSGTPKFLLIRDAEVYSPSYLGRQSILSLNGTVVKIGEVDEGVLEKFGIEYEFLSAKDCLVIPGLVDAHEHLIGGSGEKGFATQTPEISVSELIQAGITSVVGCLGVDSTTRTMHALLAKAKALNEEGFSAYIYSGGYDVPPKTLTGSVRSDMILVSEVIGAGEIAISDRRSTQPRIEDLARLVSDVYVGGLLTGKSGVTHFHVGPGPEMLEPLRLLLNDYDIKPESLYPTHVERTEALMKEAIELTQIGVTVDIDTQDVDVAEWVSFYLAHGGHPERMTVSSDAAISSPFTLFSEIQKCIRNKIAPLEKIISLVTSNPARVLGLKNKGNLKPGGSMDAVVLDQATFEICHVIGGGQIFMKDRKIIHTPKNMKSSNRRIEIYGQNQKEF